jgi:magnesium chelatase subunit I
LPDLSERIQVGLLNVLEERDIQIRGYKIRLPLDVMLVASANPDDYTNRGRIITPLKDRFGSQIRTHYPLDIETEIAVVRQESRPASIGAVQVRTPKFMEEIIATISHLARANSQVNQRSGVSVRLTTSNQELLCANAVRRALRAGETDVAPRVSDLDAIAASTAGKIEIDAVEDGREGQIFQQLVRGAVLQVFKQHSDSENLRAVAEEFSEGVVVQTGEDIISADYVVLLEKMPALRTTISGLTNGDESPAALASAVEFVLEGLHLSKRLNKDATAGRAVYRAKN